MPLPVSGAGMAEAQVWVVGPPRLLATVCGGSALGDIHREAIQAMQGKSMGGRDLTVNIARPPRSGGYGGGYGDARRNSY